jgi:hypothetical protein
MPSFAALSVKTAIMFTKAEGKSNTKKLGERDTATLPQPFTEHIPIRAE